MTTLKHLLAATDLSAPARHVVDRGFLLAKESGAQYTVMHALALDTLEELRQLLGDKISVVMQRIEAEARDALTQAVSDPTRNLGISAAILIERGLALSAVPARARSGATDLILIGAHGQDFLQDVLLGSTTSRLLRKSRCPVLIVKQPAHAPYKRVLIPVDFSPASEIAVRTARLVAPAAHIDLLHVFDVPFEGKMHFAGVSEYIIYHYRNEARLRAFNRLEAMATAAGLPAANHTSLVLHGAPALQILAEEEKDTYDLIAMGKHGTHVTEELLIGSVTKRVLALAECDVLVVVDECPAIDPLVLARPLCEEQR
jgi:nucleotide-binding universal stress UspA family protein